MDQNRFSPNKNIQDKHLIAEQPGMTILIVGLAISIFIGSTIKSLLSPVRVSAQIEKAASHIHRDLNVKFGEAHISLSYGILPRFSVVINDVVMKSENLCWGKPSIEIDTVTLPLSVWGLVTGNTPVKSVNANEIVLNIQEDPRTCTKASRISEVVSNSAPAPVISSERGVKRNYEKNIMGININNFKIIFSKVPQYSTELTNFSIKVKSFEPRVIELTAKTSLLQGMANHDYRGHANLFVQYKESPEPTLQAHLFGNWREGHYSLIGTYTLVDSLLGLELDLKNIPLARILDLLAKYDLGPKNIAARNTWFSSKASMRGEMDQIFKSPLNFRDLRLEGDLGEVVANQLHFTSLYPLEFQPFNVEFRRVDMEKFLNLFDYKRKNSFIGNMGSFVGRADVASTSHISIKGEHRDLSFVFANKGKRELQVLDSIVGDIRINPQGVKLSIQRIEPRGGQFVGAIELEADSKFNNFSLHTQVDEFLLSSEVQKLMTDGGALGSISFDADIKVKDYKLEKLKAQAFVDSMLLEGLSFSGAKSSFIWQNEKIQMQPQIKKLGILRQSPTAAVLSQVIGEEAWVGDVLSLQNFTAKFSFVDFSEFQWKNTTAFLPNKAQLFSEGAWNKSAELVGTMKLRKDKQLRQWELGGTRETPEFKPRSHSK